MIFVYTSLYIYIYYDYVCNHLNACTNLQVIVKGSFVEKLAIFKVSNSTQRERRSK